MIKAVLKNDKIIDYKEAQLQLSCGEFIREKRVDTEGYDYYCMRGCKYYIIDIDTQTSMETKNFYEWSIYSELNRKFEIVSLEGKVEFK